MAGPSASFDGDGDAVMFDDNNDDFQLPDNFDNMVNAAAPEGCTRSAFTQIRVLPKQKWENKKDFEKEAWSISVNSTIDTVSPSSK